MLDSVKLALRITNHEYNDEVTDLIEACKSDLILSGISLDKVLDTDPLIKRAVVVYCKAHFGFNNPDYDKFITSYTMLKSHLCLAGDYIDV